MGCLLCTGNNTQATVGSAPAWLPGHRGPKDFSWTVRAEGQGRRVQGGALKPSRGNFSGCLVRSPRNSRGTTLCGPILTSGNGRDLRCRSDFLNFEK